MGKRTEVRTQVGILVRVVQGQARSLLEESREKRGRRRDLPEQQSALLLELPYYRQVAVKAISMSNSASNEGVGRLSLPSHRRLVLRRPSVPCPSQLLTEHLRRQRNRLASRQSFYPYRFNFIYEPSFTVHFEILPSVIVGDSAGMAKLWAAKLAEHVRKAINHL